MLLFLNVINMSASKLLIASLFSFLNRQVGFLMPVYCPALEVGIEFTGV